MALSGLCSGRIDFTVKIIDAHVHFSRIASFEDFALHTSLVDYSMQGYLSETDCVQVVKSVCMGLVENSSGSFPDTGAPMPMTTDLGAGMPEGMYLCLGINPFSLTKRSLAETEDMIKNNPRVVGMKIYAGYYHMDITDPVYDAVYDLAERYDKTITIHTGDTFSNRALVKYAHPLRVDDLAVARPDLRIVACHMGTPWVFDACQVAVKNPNVYIDTSALLVGSAQQIAGVLEIPMLTDRYRQALAFLNNYDKVIYGTDWPLAPMGAYLDFCKKLIPVEAHEKVFFNNAVKVYGL